MSELVSKKEVKIGDKVFVIKPITIGEDHLATKYAGLTMKSDGTINMDVKLYQMWVAAFSIIEPKEYHRNVDKIKRELTKAEFEYLYNEISKINSIPEDLRKKSEQRSTSTE